MVQSYQSPVRVYKWPFEFVMAAYELRFPTCPQIPIVVGTEVVEEDRSPCGASVVTTRRCQLNIDAPYLLKKVSGVDFVYFTQKNSLDRIKRRLDIEATNITFETRIGIKEFCCYYVHPEKSDWTCFEQSAELDVKSMFGFEATVEKIAVKQYAANLQKGKEILEHFIQQLLDSGISATDMPVFRGAAVPSAAPPALDHSDSAIELSSKLDGLGGGESTDSEEYKDAETGEEPGHSGLFSRSRTGTIVRREGADKGSERLTVDYIQRFLGQLTQIEESRLCQLKYSLQSSHKGKLPNDAHLLRFLRAREFEVGAAKEMVLRSLLWRKSHAVDKILSTYTQPPVIQQFFPGAWHHSDMDGRPLFVLRLGMMDLKGLMRSVGEEGLVRLILSLSEDGLRRCAEATMEKGKPISTWSLLVDLEGLSMRHLWRPGLKAIFRAIEIMEANYPETMGLALIVRTPRVFPVLWTLIGPLIDENTKNKFMVHSSAEIATNALGQFLEPSVIPHFLGGPAFFQASEGGHVPKALQTFHSDSSDEHILESYYTTGYVYKGLPHEVLVNVPSGGAVVTWDFDVVKGGCEFGLLRTPSQVSGKAQPSPPLGPLSPGALVAAMGDGASAVAFDPSLRLGLDLFVEAKPIKAQEGDSVQGSHYCAKPGTYVLQWRHADPAPPHHQTFDFSLPGKCKLVYYWEILDSDNYRGSMASLGSCRSSFSSLAAMAKSSGNGSLAGSETPASSIKHTRHS